MQQEQNLQENFTAQISFALQKWKKYENQRKTVSSCINNLETEAGFAEQLQTGSGTTGPIGTALMVTHLFVCFTSITTVLYLSTYAYCCCT